jgi:hypothetical protein
MLSLELGKDVSVQLGRRGNRFDKLSVASFPTYIVDGMPTAKRNGGLVFVPPHHAPAGKVSQRHLFFSRSMRFMSYKKIFYCNIDATKKLLGNA